MADYPTYSQTNKADGYTKPVSEVGGRLRSPAVDVKNDCRDQVLDLSGKPGGSSVAMVTGRPWRTSEQDAALDLSSHGKPTSGQAEALDLSKRSTPPVRSSLSQSHPVSVGILQSHHPLPSRKLLEKALTSGLSSSDFQLGPFSTSHIVSRHSDRNSAELTDSARSDIQRRAYEGLGVRPFSSAGFKPVGLSMPQVTLPNAGTRLVHTQKPIAITTPQPHISSVNTSKQSDTSTETSPNHMVSEHPIRGAQNVSTSHSYEQEPSRPMFNVQNLPFSSAGYMISRPSSGHGMPTSFGAAIDNTVDRYVVRRPGTEGNFQENTKTNAGRTESQLGFNCPACPKVFKSKAAMKLHMTVHKTSEERQFVCQVCQRRFLHRHHLIVHQRKHSGEKPYRCNACSKSFMAVFLLHKHLRKHTREQGQSNEISSEQLKQLHGRKRTTSRSGGIETICFGDQIKTEKPELVIVSDEEDAGVNSRSNADDKGRCDEQRILCSDGNVRNESANSSELTYRRRLTETVTDNAKIADIKTEELKGVNANVEITNIEIMSNSVKILASSFKEKDGHGVKTKLVIKEIEYDSTVHPERTSETMDITNNHTIGQTDNDYSDKQSVPNENIPETLLFKDKKLLGSNVKLTEFHDKLEKTEDIDPWPKFTSDDEVELDYLTGEMKILNKADIGCKIDSTETEEITAGCETVEVTHNDKSDTENEEENIVETGAASQRLIQIEQSNHCDVNKEEKNSKRQVSGIENETVNENTAKRLKVDEAESQQRTLNGDIDNAISVEVKVSCPSIEKTVKRKSKEKRNRGKRKLKRFKCETCMRNFFSQHHLLLHMNSHKKNLALDALKKAKANQINVAFAIKSGFTCNVCDKNFVMQKGLNSHMRIHSSKLAENKLLSRKFRDFLMTDVSKANPKDNAKNLIQIENVESQENANTILATEADTDDFVNTKEHSIESNAYPSSNNFNLEDNIQIIIGKDKSKPYVCHACNNTYTTKQKLKMHALIHKDNSYLCDMCGKSFFREATLQKHVGTHMLPRPHVCAVCKKSFIHRSSLMRHKTIHESPTTASIKQQSQDIKFELEMLGTYEMLRKERLERMHTDKMDDLKIEAPSTNLDVMDLSLPRRNDQLTPQKREENLQPPKLSPMTIPHSVPSTSASLMHLSPPNITKEHHHIRHLEIKDEKTHSQMSVKQNESEVKTEHLPKRSRSTRPFYSNTDEREGETEGTIRPRQRRRKSRVYPTSCRICKEIFPNVIGLKAHMSVHNSVETHLYECNVCGHRFTQSCSLLRHMKTSCGDGDSKLNKLQCKTCEKVFQRRNAYDRHMDSHLNGEPPKLNVSLHGTRTDEAEATSPRLFQTNLTTDSMPLRSKADINTEANAENFCTPHITPENKDNYDDELSEAETIPYGKTSSDESNDGFSDSSETESDQEQPRPQSLPSNNSLNLLSEVCSSLINIEKEAEIKKQSELISVQKELETIDILARLSRQNVSRSIKTETETFDSGSIMNENKKSKHYPVERITANLIPKREPLEVQEMTRNIKVEENESAKIPTVVNDIESDTEKRQRSYFIRMQQRILEGTPRSLQNFSPSTVCTPQQQKPSFKSNSLLAAALFDKGKPDPISFYKPASNSFSSSMNSDLIPTDLSIKKKAVPITPLNLSPRASPILRETLMGAHSSLTVPHPPPLVPVFKCPNCGKLLYNKTDYRQHMHEHGISPPDSPEQYAQVEPPEPYHRSFTVSSGPPEMHGSREATMGSADIKTDYTKLKVPQTSSWQMAHVKSEPDHLPSGPPPRVIPPSTLNFSPRKYGPLPLAIPSTSKSTPSHSVASTPDLDSPMYSSSDFSDVTLSPVGSVALNTDILRKELRNKIYARRKSQGLEELTVEFKPPEKTEMTQEEVEKLQHRRESNRQAAQRSRMRKKDRIISLLDELHQEESIQKSIRRQMEIMENEKNALLSILENHECVKDELS